MNLHQAIYKLNPTVVTIRGDVAYDANDNEVTYNKAQAEALVQASSYQAQRVLEYPSIEQQLDMQYWDSVNGTTTWKAAIDAVKTKYPKG